MVSRGDLRIATVHRLEYGTAKTVLALAEKPSLRHDTNLIGIPRE